MRPIKENTDDAMTRGVPAGHDNNSSLRPSSSSVGLAELLGRWVEDVEVSSVYLRGLTQNFLAILRPTQAELEAAVLANWEKAIELHKPNALPILLEQYYSRLPNAAVWRLALPTTLHYAFARDNNDDKPRGLVVQAPLGEGCCNGYDIIINESTVGDMGRAYQGISAIVNRGVFDNLQIRDFFYNTTQNGVDSQRGMYFRDGVFIHEGNDFCITADTSDATTDVLNVHGIRINEPATKFGPCNGTIINLGPGELLIKKGKFSGVVKRVIASGPVKLDKGVVVNQMISPKSEVGAYLSTLVSMFSQPAEQCVESLRAMYAEGTTPVSTVLAKLDDLLSPNYR